MKKTYILKPTMTFNTLTSVPASHKPCERTVDEIVNTIMPGKPAAVPAHQPRFVPGPAQENRGRPGAPTGRGPVALAHGPLHAGRSGTDSRLSHHLQRKLNFCTE